MVEWTASYITEPLIVSSILAERSNRLAWCQLFG